MEQLEQHLPQELSIMLGEKAKALRLLAGWKRATLATRAGVSESSLKRFEQTGQASLDLVLRVAVSLGRLSEFEPLLDPPTARSIAELDLQRRHPIPKRGVR